MKNKRNIFSEWINKIKNRNRPNEGIYYVSQRLRRTAKVVIPELNGLQDSINGVNDRLQTLDNNAAKKNTTNTFTQKQTFRNEVEFGTNIKMGYGAGVVNLTPEDDSNKTLNIQRFDINMNNKKISNLATPTSNNDAVNKGYVDAKSTELTNEINSIKQKNTEQDGEITNIKKKNNTQESDILELNKRVDTQTTEINSIKQKNTQQDNRITTLENKPSGGVDWTQIQEVTDGNAIRLKALLQLVGINPELPAPTVYSMLGILPQDIRLINDYDGTTNTLKLGRDGLSLNNQPITPFSITSVDIPNRTWTTGTSIQLSVNIPSNAFIVSYTIISTGSNEEFPLGKVYYNNRVIGEFTLECNKNNNTTSMSYWSSNNGSHTLAMRVKILYTIAS